MQTTVETRVGIFVLAALGVFVYLGFRIGSFRFDRNKYNTYYLISRDVEGISGKADIKIAGVKVGWVESISLMQTDACNAQMQIMIAKEYVLHNNAFALIRQEGILGQKYIEIVPGTCHYPPLKPFDCITQSSQPSISVDEMMKQMQTIMIQVQEITGSIKELIASPYGKNQMRSLVDSLQTSAEKVASLTSWLDQPEQKEQFTDLLSLGSHIKTMCNTVNQSVHDVADQTQLSLKTVNSVANKIDQGQGCIGKLLNDDRIYTDFEYVMGGLKYYFKKIEAMEFVFDSHVEGMFHHAENYRLSDAKGYFDMKIYPSEDYFYLFQVMGSEKGFAYRKQIDHTFIDQCNRPVDIAALDLPEWARVAYQYNRRKAVFERNTILFGFQFGKIFRDIALRFGIFEGTVGVALDIDIPFRTDNFRWVSTFEIFDLRGWNRRNDHHAHLKWLNRVYLFRTVYAAFGADDFISKHNANFFFGLGVRFGDDDVKYLFASI